MINLSSNNIQFYPPRKKRRSVVRITETRPAAIDGVKGRREKGTHIGKVEQGGCVNRQSARRGDRRWGRPASTRGCPRMLLDRETELGLWCDQGAPGGGSDSCSSQQGGRQPCPRGSRPGRSALALIRP
jgi:hypothetical protein